jgi:hypothetical protein
MLQREHGLKVGEFRTLGTGAWISDILIDKEDGHLYEQRTDFDDTPPPYVIGTYGDLQRIADNQRIGVVITYRGDLRTLHEALVKKTAMKNNVFREMYEHVCPMGPNVIEDQFYDVDDYDPDDDVDN